MFLSLRPLLFYPLSIQIVILGILNPCFSATFNAKTQFSWVDSSCDSVIDKVNDAGDDLNALVKAAIANLEGGSPSTDLGKRTLLAYFGTPVGQLINLKYGKLQSAFAAQPINLGLYCDGSAFEWVTTYQEGPKKGENLPNNGQWHAKEDRYNPAEGPLYLDGTKTPQRTNICQSPDGKDAQGVSSVGGKHIILCPDAFKEPVLGAIPTGEQTIGTSLDTLTSTGAVLLHEATHCILSTTDTPGGYKVNGVLLTAKISAKAQKNADTWMYYAMASLAAKNAWVIGLAQALDNFGPKAPKAPPSTGKRDTMPLEVRGPRAIPDNDATKLLAVPGSPILEGRAAGPDTVTVTITVTKDCPGSGVGGSTSGGNTRTDSTGTGTGLTGTRSASNSLNTVGSTGSGSTGPGGNVTTGVGSTGVSHTGPSLTGTGSGGPGSTATGSVSRDTTGSGATGKGSTGTGTGGPGSTASGSVGTASVSSGSNAPSASSGTGTPNTNTASGFTTVKSNPGSSSASAGGGGYIGPVPISAQPASITAALASESSVNVIGLTTFTGTTTPTPVVISSSVSSNGHSKETNGVGPFPIFWSHTCWFCPPGLCLSCGVQLNLPKGIYPPGSIAPPPGWTGPLPTITIGDDGTPSYDEEKPTETNQQPSNTKTSQASSATSPSSATRTSAASSSASSASSGVNYIFETPAIYSEVSDTIPFESVSAIVASDFAANSLNAGGGGSATSGTASAASTQNSQPVSTTFSSSKRTNAAPTTTPMPSTTLAQISATPPAFSCSSLENPDYDYPCLCQGFHYCASAGGGCGWTTRPAAENCCEDCH